MYCSIRKSFPNAATGSRFNAANTAQSDAHEATYGPINATKNVRSTADAATPDHFSGATNAQSHCKRGHPQPHQWRDHGAIHCKCCRTRRYWSRKQWRVQCANRCRNVHPRPYPYRKHRGIQLQTQQPEATSMARPMRNLLANAATRGPINGATTALPLQMLPHSTILMLKTKSRTKRKSMKK